MTKEQTQEDFKNRLNELVVFLQEKQISLSAVQQMNKETGYIDTVPVFRDLKKYPEEVVAEKISDAN